MTHAESADRNAVRAPVSAQFRRIHRESDGFSLVEVLMVILLLGIVMGATLSVLSNARGFVGGDIQASHTVEDAQVGLNRMVRELRQATAVSIYNNGTLQSGATPSGNQVQATVTLNGASTQILYQCNLTPAGSTLFACLRKTGTTFATSTAGNNVVASQLQSATFSNPSTKYYKVVLQLKSLGNIKSTSFGHSITLTDGFYGRNL
jgi:prepilin-type N-terminal cleavage/methylation domain-containing protein